MAQNKKRSAKSNKKTEQIVKKPVNYFMLLGICVIAILIFLSLCFDVTGVAGQFIKSVLVGILGISAYILPFYMIIAAGSMLFAKDVKHTKIRCWFGAIAILLLCIFLHIVSKNAFIYKNVRFGEYVKLLYSGGSPTALGGVLGGLIAAPLLMLLDKVGSAIIIGALLVFCLVMSLYKVFGYIKKRFAPIKEEVSEVVKETIPEQPDYSELRARREAEREEKRLAAAQKKEEKQAQRKARAEAFSAHADEIDRSKATIVDIPITGGIDEVNTDINEKAGMVIDALNTAPIMDNDYMNQFEDELPIAQTEHPAPAPKTVADIKAEEI